MKVLWMKELFFSDDLMLNLWLFNDCVELFGEVMVVLEFGVNGNCRVMGMLVFVLKFVFLLMMLCWILILLYSCLMVLVFIFGKWIWRVFFFFMVIGRFFSMVSFCKLVKIVVRFFSVWLKLVERILRRFLVFRLVVVVLILKFEVWEVDEIVVVRGVRVVMVGFNWKLMYVLGVEVVKLLSLFIVLFLRVDIVWYCFWFCGLSLL